MNPEKLKLIILHAQAIHEESYIESLEHYHLDNRQSAAKAVFEFEADIRWIDIVYYLNSFAWNDIQNWKV